jgi:hypothetical protein
LNTLPLGGDRIGPMKKYNPSLYFKYKLNPFVLNPELNRLKELVEKSKQDLAKIPGNKLKLQTYFNKSVFYHAFPMEIDAFIIDYGQKVDITAKKIVTYTIEGYLKNNNNNQYDIVEFKLITNVRGEIFHREVKVKEFRKYYNPSNSDLIIEDKTFKATFILKNIWPEDLSL